MYLGRLFMEAKRRPLFVIDWVIRGDQVATAAAEPFPGYNSSLSGARRPDDGRPLAP
jgi:hypothetical protein